MIFSFQQASAASIDETIERYFAPFSDALSSIIFTSISLNGAKLPILILFMLVSSFFLTFYFRGMNIWGFKHGMKQIFNLKVFVRELGIGDDQNPNYIEIEGYVCKPTVYRTTPFGREICDVLLAVNRAYNKSDYIPCIAWGRNARYAESFVVGDKVLLSGRIQSREYQKGLEDGSYESRTAYEVSINKLEKTE